LSLNTAEVKGRLDQAIACQDQPTVTVLSSLLAVEDELGFIPPEAIEAVAKATGTTVNDVWGVASFYTNFRFTPPSCHRIEVCWGASCHVLGASQVAVEVLGALGLKTEGDTDDGNVEFRFNTCLGACAQGPVISIDHNLKGRLSPGAALGLIQALVNETTGGPHA
jgi:NADH-quinone oxidoreductase subunit E